MQIPAASLSISAVCGSGPVPGTGTKL